ncbi:CIC11C00000002434 [Sungouiella intermedia]|uniref:CIC11C00000002434 n=1 Tax=Sungouiella intermedia TaxID=45354 RepID=A0A1L0DCP1_9ASCO|nr:CIC11C00000002434 [[Candida] intermedia]
MSQKRSSVLFNMNASPFVPASLGVAGGPNVNITNVVNGQLPHNNGGVINGESGRSVQRENLLGGQNGHYYTGQTLASKQSPLVGFDVVLVLPPASRSEFDNYIMSKLPQGDFTVQKYALGSAVLTFDSSVTADAAVETLNGQKWHDGDILATLIVEKPPISRSDSTAFADSTARDSAASSDSATPIVNSASPPAFGAPPGPIAGPTSTPGPIPPGIPPSIPYDVLNESHEQPIPGANPYFFLPPPYGYPIDYGYYGNPMPYPPYGYYGVTPMNARTPSRRSSSRSNSRQNSVGGSTKPPPPFLLNMVKRDSSLPGTASQSSDSSPLETPDMEDFISVEDDEGNAIKVNLRRLFVGNIPFNSTWPALKNFLITKAEELEPGNHIEILRVEIPMQQPRDVPNNASKLNSYQFLTLLSQQLNDKSGPPTPDAARTNSSSSGPTRGLSRGFAIVTTANKLSLEKIIKYFDNVEFEGRTLTVRYDRFPDFNNYVLQQLYPSSKSQNKPAFLSNLAFERNSFQQKFYYGLGPMVPYRHRGSQSKPYNEFPPYNDITMDALAGSLGEIEIENNTQSPQSLNVTDEEKARDLVNSIVARDLST